MARGSNVSFEISYSKVPILEGALELARDGVVPGGSKSNHKWILDDVEYEDLLSEEQLVLCDAITSGGLLVSMSEEEAVQYVDNLHSAGKQHAAIVGRVTEKKEKLIYAKR
jgi:selenide,water dikinase